MDILPVHFGNFKLFGLWYDENTNESWAFIMIHRAFVLISASQFTVLQMLAPLVTTMSIEEFAENLFVMITFMVNLYKIFMFINKRDRIIDLLNQFRLEICKPQNSDEDEILSRYLQIAKSAYMFRMILTVSCGIAFLMVPIINTRKIELPHEMILFDVNSPVRFVIAYILQTAPVMITVVTDVCLDSFYCAWIILTCGQLHLCCHRIITDQEKSVKRYVQHHVLIIEIVAKIQSVFISSVLPVFASALMTLCTSIYQLAQKTTTMIEYFFILSYLACLLCQIYYLCWFGNELQIKSEKVIDAIYTCDWVSLSPKDRKSFWFIMFMSRRELAISYHGQCTLALYTFIWMIKTSYGAFNLLQRVSKEE